MNSPRRPVDDSALTAPVDRQAAIDFETTISKRWNLESARMELAGAVLRGIFGGLILAGVGLGLVVLATAVVLSFVNRTLDPPRMEPILAYYLPCAVVGVVLLVVVTVQAWRRSDPTTRRYRLDQFARANGWTYTPVVRTLVRPGMMFETGTTRATYDVIGWEDPRSVEIGDHVYSPSPFRNEVVRRGYVGIRLDVSLPHIVLDAVKNNLAGEGSSLRFRVDPAQKLSLEGDFDRHFALYCPEGYERDALYLFSPDIMARFIDHAADFDVEITDDWLMLSTRDQVCTLDPAEWQQLLDLIAAIEHKLGQWGRWRDEHPGTAPTYRRPRPVSPMPTRQVLSPVPTRQVLPLAPTRTTARTHARRIVAPRGKRLTSRRFRWGPLLGFVVAIVVLLGPLIVATVLFGPW